MKKTLKLLALLPLFCGLLLTTACNKDKDDENPFVGTWRITHSASNGEYDEWTFRADKTLRVDSFYDGRIEYTLNGTYSWNSSTITIILPDSDMGTMVAQYEFINKTTLRLDAGYGAGIFLKNHSITAGIKV